MSELARVVGVSERTVSRRLRRLLADGVLRLTASSLPPLHPHLHAQVEITCEPRKIVQVAEQLADRDDTHYVHLTAGTADVWVEFYAQNQADLLHRLTTELPHVDGVVSTRTRMVVRMLMSANDWDPDNTTAPPIHQRLHPTETGESPDIDDLDRRLGVLLTQNSRAPVTELAQSLQISEATAHRRLNKLISSRAIVLRAEVPAAALGYPVEALFALRIEPKHLTAGLMRLAEVSSLRALYLVTGPHNVVGYAVYPTVADVQQLINDTLAELDGIQGSDLDLVLASPKRLGTRLHPDLSTLTTAEPPNRPRRNHERARTH